MTTTNNYLHVLKEAADFLSILWVICDVAYTDASTTRSCDSRFESSDKICSTLFEQKPPSHWLKSPLDIGIWIRSTKGSLI